MSSASGSKIKGSILILALVMISILSGLSLTGLARTNHQSQLATVLVYQAELQMQARRALAMISRRVRALSGDFAGATVPGCPERCEWENAQRVDTATDTDIAYITQRLAPKSRRVLISVRATRSASGGNGKFITHGLFDTDTDRFLFIL